MQWIDLRSDTVTKPTEEMRRAMAEAEVGDDVYGEDPTVNRLEENAAEVFGREAALFVPTGTMGNQIAVKLHTQPGQEVICESHAHLLDWEMATMASFGGCIARAVTGQRGVLSWKSIAPAIAPKIYYRAQTALVWIENTHNMAGGTVTPVDVLEDLWCGSRQTGLKTHCDGARIFNAAAAAGVPVQTLSHGFDTVMFCLSKGLGAPVGSLLVGSKDVMEHARGVRKALGGGMRQAGVLAAAGLLALANGPARLHEDHANARMLAERIAESGKASVDLEAVQTNIVFFEVPGDAGRLVAVLREARVLASAVGPHAVRLVTHRDVSTSDCERAAAVIVAQLRS